tara:strand:+ start:1468 stop:1656 length:189 start_codon:yes stop_codon:yes gene_type:complete
MSSHNNLEVISLGNILKKSSSTIKDFIPEDIIIVNNKLIVIVSLGYLIDILLKKLIYYINTV